jgi:hypothetical protein
MVQAAWLRDQQPMARCLVLALQTALNARDLTAVHLTTWWIQPSREAFASADLPAGGFPTLGLFQRLL